MIDISNLSLEELVALQKQIKAKLNSVTGLQSKEDELDNAIDSFNRLCELNKTNFVMSMEEDSTGIAYLHVMRDNYMIHSELFKSKKDALVIAKKHISLIPIYTCLSSLVASSLSFEMLTEHFFEMSFYYDSVKFNLRQDSIDRTMYLDGSLSMNSDSNSIELNVDRLNMTVRSESWSNVKIELADNRVIERAELQNEIESMTERLKNKIEALTSF